MNKIFLFLIFSSNIIYSQIRGISSGTAGTTKDSHVFFSKDCVISKEFVYTDFLFNGELKKIEIKDSLFIDHNSNKKENYKQKYYSLTKDNLFKTVFYGHYLKKNDTVFKNYKSVTFTNTKFDTKLFNEFINHKIKLSKEDFIFELGKWQIQIKNLKEEKTEILTYFDYQFLYSDIIYSAFLNECFYFEEKMFLRFDHTVFWYALSPEK